MTTDPAPRPVLLVVGNGMVGHHFLEAAVDRGLHTSHEIVVLGEERRRAYDRVHLTTAFEGADPDALCLGDSDFHEASGIRLVLGDRGGVAVDDTLVTSDPHVSAIGEVAAHRGGRPYGLVAPGYRQADVVADRLAGREAAFTGADTSTKLKLLGVDVASVGDCFAVTEGAEEIVYTDPVAGVYKKLVVSGDGTRILGGVLVGDASA